MSWSNKQKDCPDCEKTTKHHKHLNSQVSEENVTPYTESCEECGHQELGLEIYGLTDKEKDKETNGGWFTG
jgi:C4-type Zn-finger protein